MTHSNVIDLVHKPYYEDGVRYTHKERTARTYTVNDAVKAATQVLKDRRRPQATEACLDIVQAYKGAERDEPRFTLTEHNNIVAQIIDHTIAFETYGFRPANGQEWAIG